MGLDNSAQRVLEGLEEHMRQMAGNVHEVEVGIADELDLGSLKHAIVILTDKASVLNGFLGEVLNVGLGADDADIVGVAMMALIGQGDVLTDEHTDADTGHVEAIEEGLNGAVDLHALTTALVLEDTLGHGGDDTVVAALDVMQSLGETLVVEMEVGGPVTRVIDEGKVAAGQ